MITDARARQYWRKSSCVLPVSGGREMIAVGDSFFGVFGVDEHVVGVFALHTQAQRRRTQSLRCLGEYLHPFEFFVLGQQIDTIVRLRPDHARAPAPIGKPRLSGKHLEVHITGGGKGGREDRKRAPESRIVRAPQLHGNLHSGCFRRRRTTCVL